jgi:hypothetical protein
MENIVIAVTLTVFILVALFVSFIAARDKLRETKQIRENMIRSSDQLTNALVEFNRQIPEISEAFKSQPKLLEGLIAVSQAQVKELEGVSGIVAQLHRALFSKDGDGYQEYSEGEASRQYEIERRMTLDNVDRDQATRIVEEGHRETDLYSQMKVER